MFQKGPLSSIKIIIVFIHPVCIFSLYIQVLDEMELRPVFTDEGITFVYVKVNPKFCYILKIFDILGYPVVQQFIFNGCYEKKFKHCFSSIFLVSIN